MAQKIFTDTPIVDEIQSLALTNEAIEKEFESFYKTAQTYLTIMPNVKGLPAMDALALLENMGLKVKLSGTGIVKNLVRYSMVIGWRFSNLPK